MKHFHYEDPNFIGNRLRELRMIFGFTQGSVAEVLGVNRSTYSYYELGTTRPDPVVLGILADLYRVPVDVFYVESLPMGDLPQVLASPNRRTSRTASGFDPKKVGELLPEERSLILLLRANGFVSCEEVLTKLKAHVDKLAFENLGKQPKE